MTGLSVVPRFVIVSTQSTPGQSVYTVLVATNSSPVSGSR